MAGEEEPKTETFWQLPEELALGLLVTEEQPQPPENATITRSEPARGCAESLVGPRNAAPKGF
jgi:hypothetical protein